MGRREKRKKREERKGGGKWISFFDLNSVSCNHLKVLVIIPVSCKCFKARYV